jgi:hypothetical protein
LTSNEIAAILKLRLDKPGRFIYQKPPCGGKRRENNYLIDRFDVSPVRKEI